MQALLPHMQCCARLLRALLLLACLYAHLLPPIWEGFPSACLMT